MHFHNPYFFYLLFFIPLYFFFLYIQKKKKRGVFFSTFNDLHKACKSKINYILLLKYLKYLLVFLLLFFFVFTLARPQGSYQKTETGKKGIDIIIALDVSASMLAEDLKPNRIEAAKQSLLQFLDQLQDDRLGIIVFAGKAFTQSPLTFDYNILREYIKNISTDSITSSRSTSGTAIGDAILSAVNRFKDSKERSKVLILITDGDANTGVNPELAAQKAKKENIKIYTIGVGKRGGAPMPTTDFFGRKTYVRNRDGSLLMLKFNEKALQKIAQIGGGKYFRADDKEGFKKIMQEINSLEKREIKVNTVTEYTENFLKFLYILMFLLFFLVVVNFKV